MSNWIADITRIHVGALKDRSTIPQYTIAQRMSWAATRETTRSEDIAYCLLGIFDIHMYMLYGEGDTAFKRLQEEIMRNSDDHSIFAWESQGSEKELCSGALATSPKVFLSCGSVVRDHHIVRSPFMVTNLGLSIKFSCIQTWFVPIILVGLNCAKELRGCDDPLNILPNGRTFCRRFQAWIFLRHVQDNIYQRVHLPASTVFLQPLYTDSVEATSTGLLIETQKSPRGRPLTLPTPLMPLIRESIQSSLFSSGLTITFGWGVMNKFNGYDKAFNFGQICSQTLKGRSPLGVSHQIVSNQNFSLIFSVAWSQDMHPRHWTHSVFEDADGRFWRGVIGVEKWKRLFNDGIRASTSGTGPLVDILSHVHNQLRRDFREAFQQAGHFPHAPMVVVSPQELQNLHGECELLVDIIFREKPHQILR